MKTHNPTPRRKRACDLVLGLILMIPGLPLFGGTLAVEVEGPLFNDAFATYQLTFRNDAASHALQSLQTNWMHRLADTLHALPQNSAFDSSFVMMLDWQIAIDPAGTTAKGWYLERGIDMTHVEAGLFGADTWEESGELILTVGIPLSQGTHEIGVLTPGLRAEHYAEGTETGSTSFLTRPLRGALPQDLTRLRKSFGSAPHRMLWCCAGLRLSGILIFWKGPSISSPGRRWEQPRPETIIRFSKSCQ